MNSANVTVPWKLGTAPGRFPALSHPVQMLRRPLDFLSGLRAAGDIVKVRLGAEWAYFVRHPALLRSVLSTDHHRYDKGGPFFDKARTIAGNGILTCPAKDHGRQRRMMQPLFTHERLADYAAVMTDEAEQAAAALAPGQTIEVNKTMSALTLAVTTRTLFSTRTDDAMVVEAQDAIIAIFAGLYQRMVLPVELFHQLPTAENRRFDRAMLRYPAIVDQIIAERRRSGVARGDLLGRLLAARDPESGEGLSDVELREQVMALFVAGTETTASALTSTFHLLDRHPEIARRVEAEAAAVLGGRAATYADLPRLELTARVFTEAMRLYPPGWILTRRTTGPAELGGHRIEDGATILFSPYALHRDPEFFTEPERFDPDRWLPEREEALPRFAMIPFSAGKRKCMGDAFAMNLATIVLATLAGRVRLRASPRAEVRVLPKMTLSIETTPMTIAAIPRASA